MISDNKTKDIKTRQGCFPHRHQTPPRMSAGHTLYANTTGEPSTKEAFTLTRSSLTATAHHSWGGRSTCNEPAFDTEESNQTTSCRLQTVKLKDVNKTRPVNIVFVRRRWEFLAQCFTETGDGRKFQDSASTRLGRLGGAMTCWVHGGWGGRRG